MLANNPGHSNSEGLRCPKCGSVLKTSIMENDVFVCSECIERFERKELQGSNMAYEFASDHGHDEEKLSGVIEEKMPEVVEEKVPEVVEKKLEVVEEELPEVVEEKIPEVVEEFEDPRSIEIEPIGVDQEIFENQVGNDAGPVQQIDEDYGYYYDYDDEVDLLVDQPANIDDNHVAEDEKPETDSEFADILDDDEVDIVGVEEYDFDEPSNEVEIESQDDAQVADENEEPVDNDTVPTEEIPYGENVVPLATDTQAQPGKSGSGIHPGLMFLLGFLLGAVATCGIVIVLSMAGIALPFAKTNNGAVPTNNSIVQNNTNQANQNSNNAQSNSNNASTASNNTSNAQLSMSASMRDVMKSLGYFDEVKVQGKGGNTLDLPIKGVPCLINVVYNGDGHFKMTAVSKSGKGSTLIDTQAPYNGTVTTFFEATPVESVEIDADGEWTVKFIPLGNMLHAKNGSITLSGDDTVFLDEENIEKIHFTHDGDGHFSVKAAVLDNGQLMTVDVLDVTGKYDNDLAWADKKAFFVVNSDGEWSMSWR